MLVDEEAEEKDENQENEEFEVYLFGLFAVLQLDFDWLELLADEWRGVSLVLH